MLCGSDECNVSSAGNGFDKDNVSSGGSKISNDDGNNVEEKEPKEKVQKSIMTFFKKSQRSVAEVVLERKPLLHHRRQRSSRWRRQASRHRSRTWGLQRNRPITVTQLEPPH
jgi:hypothetical protein